MSEVLDEKVVSMRFDNKDFEKNAEESLSTIQRLKAALNFKDAAKNLDEISRASKKVDFSAVSSSIDSIASKFSVMEYAAFSAIQNITNKFVNAAEQWVKSVTIQPVSTGFGVYEQKMSSVQTILNNSGKSLREVNKILDKLNTYSDQTIFSLNDMTTALGKFTAQGIDAAQAVTIIKGAANEAASMGAGSAEFSRFIYNLTQAYGMGKMTTIDWKSLENAGVAGAKFKEELIKSAKAMGTLDEAGRILQGSHKGMIVTAANLREYLQDGIINAKVMTDTFTRYADAETEVGAAADRAAKEVKTFHQLMDVLSESVASTWSQSFSYIIGDFYEAKQLWTNVSEIFDQTVGKMNKRRNEMLAAWKEGFIDPASIATKNIGELNSYMNSGAFIDGKKISGRTLLLEGFANILNSILQIVKPIKEAFREFFPATTAKNLWEATKNFRDFTSHLKLSEGAIREIRDAFRGVFAIFKTFKLVLKDIIGAIFPATKGVDSLAVIILKLSGAIGRLITNSLSKLRNNKSYQEFLSNVTKFSAMAIKVISTLVQWIAYLAKTAKDSGVLQEIFSDIASVVTKVFSIIVNGVPVAIRLFKLLGAGVGGIFVALSKASETFEGFFSKIFNKKDAADAKKNIESINLQKTLEKRRRQNEGTWTKDDEKAYREQLEKSKSLAENEKKNKSIFESIFSAVSTIVGNIISIVSKAWPFISGAVSVIVSFASGIINVLGNVSQVAVSIAQGIGKAISNIDTITVLLVGVFTSVTLIANSAIGIFSHITLSVLNLTRGFHSFAEGFEQGARAFKRMNNPIVLVLRAVAACVLSLAVSMWLLTTSFTNLVKAIQGADFKTVITTIGIMIFIAGLLIVLGKVFSKIEIAKQNVVTIIALSSFMKGLANAFVSITEVLKESDLLHIASSLIILASMAGLVILVGKQFEKIQVQSSSIKTIIALSIMIRVLASSFKTIAKAIEGLDLLSMGASLVIFASLGGMVMLLGKVFSEMSFETSSLRTILGLTAMMLGLTVMFRMINDAVKSTNFFQLLTSLGVFMAISAMLIEIANVFSDTEIKSGSIFGMIGISLMLSTLAKSFVKISDVVYGSDFLSVIASLGILIVFAKLLESVSKAFGNVKIDIITVLGILTFSDFIADIGEFFINALNSIKTATVWDVILALASLGALAGILVWIGEVFSDISVDDEEWITLLIVTRFMRIAGEMLVAITDSFKTASMGDIISSLGSVIIIAKILVQVAKKFTELEIQSQSIAAVVALSIFMKTLASVFKTIINVINTNTIGYIIGALGILVGMAGLLMLVGWAFSEIKIQSQSMLTIIALSIFIKTLGSVFSTIIDVITGNNLNTIIGALGILVGMAGLLMLVGFVFSEIKIQSQGMFTIIALSIFLKTLGSVFSSITEIISTNNLETIKQALTILVGMAALLVLVGVAFSLIKVKSQAMFSIIALSIFLKTLSGVFKSIVDIVRENSLETVKSSLMILVGIAGLLVLVCLAFSKIQVKPSSLVTIVMAIIGVVSIVAALSLLALVAQATSMEAVISAAESLTLALIAVAGALFIMSQFSGGVVSAAAIAIVAGSMVILAVAMGMFNDVKWDAVMNGVTVLGALALCLAVLGTIGAQTVVGAAALLVASLAITGLAFALKQFEGLDFGNMAQNFILILGVLTIFLVILGGLGAMAIMGSAALVITAAALIILGKAMQFIADSGIGGGVLSGIAGGLMLMAIAGILLSAGAMGLMMGGIGLTILGLALKLFANVPEGFGSILSGIAGGLMLFGVAGIVLSIGAAGLVAGGIGLMIVGAGLKIIQGVTIDAQRVSDLADSITDLAIAGIISDFGGDGLITLGQGLMYIAQALAILNTLSLQILSISLPGLAEDSAKIGVYIVKGAEQGILKEYPTLLKMVAQLGTGMTQVMCNVLDIHSPSGIFKKIGLWILQGLGLGVTDATMTSGLEDTMKGLATDMLSSFTDTLGDGFGKIGDMFEDFNKKTKKWVKTGGHYEYGRGWVEEGYYKEVGMFEDMLNFDEMSKSFSSLFDSSGFDGAKDLSKIFENLNNDEIDLDFSTGNLTDSLAGLSAGLGETGSATKGLTKEMGNSLDMFAEFDRSITSTTKDITKNMYDNMIAEKELGDLWNDALVAKFNPEFLETQIGSKSKKEQRAFLIDLLGKYFSPEGGQAFVDEINSNYFSLVGDEMRTAAYATITSKMKETGKSAEEMGLSFSGSALYFTGQFKQAYKGFDETLVTTNKELSNHGSALGDLYDKMDRFEASSGKAQSNVERYEDAMSQGQETAVNIAVENLSEVIMRAIDTYMPAESFVRLGKNICLGLATGIWSYTYLAERAIGMSASDLIDLFANKIDSNSPSKVFMDLGEYMMEGLAIGIKDTNDPEQATNKMADDLISHYRMIMNQIIAIMNSDEEWQPTIRPVVDFSNLQASTGALQTMFDGTQVSLAGKDFSNFKASLAPSGNGLISMSKDEMRQLLAGFADEIVRGVNNGEKNVDVQVNLEGDAKGIFKLVRDENNQYKRTAGYSAFV